MLSQDDLYLRWQPGEDGECLTIAHPVPKTPEPNLAPVAMFGGYPLVQTPTGLFFGDDHVNPFFGIFTDLASPVWHRDIMNTMGVPAVNNATVFTNVGGPNALAGMVAVNSKSGDTLWEYAPKGFPEEPADFIERVHTRELSPAEKALAFLNNGGTPSSFGRGGGANSGVPVPSTDTKTFDTPTISGEHGHWFNPGLAIVKNLVYGEVGSALVAIDQASGAKKWSFEFNAGETAHSLAASKGHVFVSLPSRLIALNLETGKMEWERPMMRAGTLTLAKGLLFFASGEPQGDGGELIVFTTDAEAVVGSKPPPP